MVSEASIVVGRDIDAAVVLADPRISRRHACIERDGDDFFLEDLKSRNGTSLNGKTVGGRKPLRHGDRICLGGAVTLRVTLVNVGDTVDSGAV